MNNRSLFYQLIMSKPVFSISILFFLLFGEIARSQNLNLTKNICASEGIANDKFGGAISMGKNLAIIGASNATLNNFNCGIAYIYTYNGTSWIQKQKLAPVRPSNNQNFGCDVAINDDYAIVGSENGEDYGGAVTVFQYNNSDWDRKQTIISTDSLTNSNFGASVSINNKFIVIGASSVNKVYIYTFDGRQWGLKQELIGENSGAEFGYSLTTSTDTLLIGAPGENAVYYYQYADTAWIKKQKIATSKSVGRFGNSVNMSNGKSIISAPGLNNQDGQAFIFKLNDTVWVEQDLLKPTDYNSMDGYGVSSSIYGNYALIGANKKSDDETSIGAAYLFKFKDASWVQDRKILALDGEFNGEFGSALAIFEENAIIGAIADEGFKNVGGSAYILDKVNLNIIQKDYLPNDTALVELFAWDDDINIDYSADQGNTWISVFDNVSSVTDSIFVPLPSEFASYKLRASKSNNINDLDYSEFNIDSLYLLFPNNINMLQAGGTNSIKWGTNGFFKSPINISYTIDSTNYIPLSTNVSIADSSSDWDIADEMIEDSVMVKIEQTKNAKINCISSGFVKFGQLIIGSIPNNLEVYSPVDITWTSMNVDTLKLEYSIDNENWLLINDTISANLAVYSWSPTFVGDKCWLKLSSKKHSNIASISNQFIIQKSTSYCYFDEFSFVEATGDSSNIDNIVLPGKKVRFKVSMFNTTGSNLLTSYAILSSQSSLVTITDAEGNYNNIDNNDGKFCQDEFEVIFADDIVVGTSVPFLITMHDQLSGGSWSSSFYITLENPVFYNCIEFRVLKVDPNPENTTNSVGINQKFRFKIQMKNDSQANIDSILVGNIKTNNPNIIIIDSLGDFTNVDGYRLDWQGNKVYDSDASSWSIDEFEVMISEMPEEPQLDFKIKFDVPESYTQYHDSWYSDFSIPFMIKLTDSQLNDDAGYDSQGNSDNIIDEYETLEVLPRFENLTDIPFENCKLKLGSNINSINVWNNIYGASGRVYNQSELMNISPGEKNIYPKWDFVFSKTVGSYSELDYYVEGYYPSNLPNPYQDEIFISYVTRFQYDEGEIEQGETHHKASSPSVVAYNFEDLEANVNNLSNYITPNRPVRLKLKVSNSGIQLRSLYAEFTTNEEGVTLTDSICSLNNIDDNESILSYDEVEFNFSEMPSNGELKFEVKLIDPFTENGIWEDSVIIPILNVNTVIFDDDPNPDSDGNDNGIAEPGETLEVLPQLINKSRYDLYNTTGELTAMASYIHVWNDTINSDGDMVYAIEEYNIKNGMHEPIRSGETATPEYDYIIDHNGTNTYTLDFNLITRVNLSSSNGVKAVYSIPLSMNEGAASPPIVITTPFQNDNIEQYSVIPIITEAFALSPTSITKVEIFIDNNLQVSMNEAHYEYKWQVGNTALGEHIIKAIMTDSNGKSSEYEVKINVIESSVVFEYCIAESDNCLEHISRVVLNTIDNESNCGNYQDFTSISTELSRGGTYKLNLTFVDTDEKNDIGVWMDFNKDGDFDDADENIICASVTGLEQQLDLEIPSSALLGTTNMRIRLKFNGEGCGFACGNSDYGEVEDYSIDILESKEPVSVIFNVNMNYQIELGNFEPSNNNLDVAGSFNDWGDGVKMDDSDGDGIYSVTIEDFEIGSLVEYKFRMNGAWDGTEEFVNGTNRSYTVLSSENSVESWYNDITPPPTAEAIPLINGTEIVIDGMIDENWSKATQYEITKPFKDESFDDANDLSAYWKAAWNDTGLFVLVHVTHDDVHYTNSEFGLDYQKDLVDIYIDMNSENLINGTGIHGGTDGNNEGHYQLDFYADTANSANKSWFNGLRGFALNSDNSYVQELFIPWADILNSKGSIFTPDGTTKIGFDVYVSDNDGPDNGVARNRMVWENDGTGLGESENYYNMDGAGRLVTNGEGVAPKADFVANNESIKLGEEVSFSDQSLFNPIEWQWNFGDGQTSDEQNPIHVYNAEGIYSVSLVVTNSFGSDEEIKSDYIVVDPAGSAPEADFSSSKTQLELGEEVSFTDLSINEPIEWLWDFGDGNTSSSQHPSHSYSSPGTYTITLSASNSFGSDEEEKSNYINVLPTNVNQSKLQPVGIYPNPTSDVFYIKATSPNLELKVNVIDVHGSVIIEKVIESNDPELIDLKDQPNGIYFVKILGNGFYHVEKLSKQ